MPPPPIVATAPITVPSVNGGTFPNWSIQELILEGSPASIIANVTLRRSAVDVNGNIVFMPDGPNATKSFSLNVTAEALTTPELATAEIAVQTGLIAWATKKNLL
jgi:hypothetical protein